MRCANGEIPEITRDSGGRGPVSRATARVVWYIPCQVFGILALAFIAVPIVEIWLIIEVGGSIGALNTVGIIVITAMVGAALAKHQGLAALQRIQRAMQNGEQVGRSLVEGALILVAGVMMLLPGFVTDAVGICLLLAPIRAVAARIIVARARTRMERGGFVVVDLDGMNRPMDRGVDEDGPPPGVIDV